MSLSPDSYNYAVEHYDELLEPADSSVADAGYQIGRALKIRLNQDHTSIVTEDLVELDLARNVLRAKGQIDETLQIPGFADDVPVALAWGMLDGFRGIETGISTREVAV